MATNGNDPRLEALENTLRGVVPDPVVDPVVDPVTHPRVFDNFVTRADLTAQACDELAQYCTSIATHLRAVKADFTDNVQQMLGKIGK